MRRTIILIAGCIFIIYAPAMAEDNWSKALAQAAADGKSIRSITPVFSQLVMFSFQHGFKPAFQNTNSGHYIQEAVLNGETLDRWSQMITLTGAKGLAANANINPESFLGGIAAGFKRACPDTFSVKAIGNLKIGAYDAFAAVAGCGTVQTGGYKHSEAAVLVSIKGASDYYTLQWAERGPPQAQPADLNDAKWQDRLKKLGPIKICPRVPGEAPPYVSCAGS